MRPAACRLAMSPGLSGVAPEAAAAERPALPLLAAAAGLAAALALGWQVLVH
jgi:hypothetical protein